MAKQTINNGESGLIVRGKLNSMFTELYADVYASIHLTGKTGVFSQSLVDGTFIQRIFFKKSSGAGDITVRIGTTTGADDIMTDTVFSDMSYITAPEVQDGLCITTYGTTIHFTITGGSCFVRIDYIPNYYPIIP